MQFLSHMGKILDLLKSMTKLVFIVTLEERSRSNSLKMQLGKLRLEIRRDFLTPRVLKPWDKLSGIQVVAVLVQRQNESKLMKEVISFDF